MKKINLLLTLSATFLIVAGCAHYPGVRAGVSGVHRVVVVADNPESGNQDAISQANSFCKDKYKNSAAFVDEKSQYTGDMKESSYKNAKKMSKAAQVVGGTVWALGGRNESNVAGVVGLGGAVADSALGQEYKVEMNFKCQ